MSARTLHLDRDGVLTNRVFLDDPRVTKLLAVLDREAETARVIGGAVRNALLGLPLGDIDVATTAIPDVIVARAKAARLRFIPTGIAHGTVTVLVGGLPFEVTTLREDVETDGRHAVVRFGRDYEADAQRRDFTINALSVDAHGRIMDTTGGLDDLAAGRVRFIGDAATRIREDYLRILRFFRFSADYATGHLDPAGLVAAVVEADGLSQLSRERVRSELLKLLVAERAADTVVAMDRAGILHRVVGTPCWPSRFERCRAIEAARSAPPDAILGLAALGLRDEADALALRDNLRLSNEERDRLRRLAAALALNWTSPKPPEARALSALLFNHGRETALDTVTLWHADSIAAADDAAWLAAARFATIAAVPALPVSGSDIMARGVTRGPLVGQTLKGLQALWIRAGFPESPTALHDLVDQAIAAAREKAGD